MCFANAHRHKQLALEVSVLYEFVYETWEWEDLSFLLFGERGEVHADEGQVVVFGVLEDAFA